MMASATIDFTHKQQASKDGLVNGLLTGMITYILLYGAERVSIMSPVGDGFSRSLIGVALIPALIIALIISFNTGNNIISNRLKGRSDRTFKIGSPTLKRTSMEVLVRLLLYVSVVVATGWTIVLLFPNMSMNQLTAAFAAFILAFVLAFIESVLAVYRTLKSMETHLEFRL
jgi:uncharacterized membrane protein